MSFGGAKCIYQYCYSHNPQDCLIITNIIEKYYPEYYQTWANFNFLYALNCFMTTKEIFNDYCKFLFDILDKFFSLVNIHDIESAKAHVFNEYKEGKYDYALKTNNFKTIDDFLKYQLNIGGFLNERLFTIYVINNHLRVLERKVNYTENYDMFVNNEEKWLYIPFENEVQPLLNYVHFNNHHLKKDRMCIHIIKLGFFWFGYTESIVNFIKKCGKCHCEEKSTKISSIPKIIITNGPHI
jgi:hypothetical protein